MPVIYDNITNQFSEGLINSLDVSYRGDFCVGYFNLRGWKQVADYIEKWNGGEGNQCRLLIGMQKLPVDLLKQYLAINRNSEMDQQEAFRI